MIIDNDFGGDVDDDGNDNNNISKLNHEEAERIRLRLYGGDRDLYQHNEWRVNN